MERQVTRQGVRRDLHFRGRLRQGRRSNTRDHFAAHPSDSSLLALWQAPHNPFVTRVSSGDCSLLEHRTTTTDKSVLSAFKTF